MIIVMSFLCIKRQKIIETTNPNLPERKVMQANCFFSLQIIVLKIYNCSNTFDGIYQLI